MARRGMQLERAMRLVAVQEDGDRGDGDVGQRERHEHGAPPWKIEDAGEEYGLLHLHLMDNRGILQSARCPGLDLAQAGRGRAAEES
ncbi:hypothetical protein GmRootV59_25810 [Variovorax sp. V59]